jgi:hypothetical protein
MESFNQDAIDSGFPEAVEENQYVILTKKDNLIHNGEFLSDSKTESGFAYYLVTGKISNCNSQLIFLLVSLQLDHFLIF